MFHKFMAAAIVVIFILRFIIKVIRQDSHALLIIQSDVISGHASSKKVIVK